MTIVKLQDIKSTPRNPLHSYTLIMRKQREKFIIIDKLDAIRHETLGTSPEGTVHNLENKI